MILRKIKKAIADPRGAALHFLKTRWAHALPDPIFLKLKYRLLIGKRLQLDPPATFNEKLQWLKLHDRNPGYSTLVDKYAVRNHIAATIGSEFLVPLLGVWKKFEDIDFHQLPGQFVLKCTHDSGGVVICRDKGTLDIAAAKNKINSCLQRNYYYTHREWPYKYVRPQIIAEQFLANASGEELRDYKVLCFNGRAKCIFLCLNRNSVHGLNIDVYDINWNRMPFGRRSHPPSSNMNGKPVNFDRMIQSAEILAQSMDFARIDFYEIDGRLYFGEITLYPASGFETFVPEKYDQILGNWLEIKTAAKISSPSGRGSNRI